MEPNSTTPELAPANRFLIPLAIVIAGGLIAGALYYGAPHNSTPNTQQVSSDIEIAKVTDKDHILGSMSAPLIIVEYSDTECPYCKVFHNTLHALVSQYSGQLAWVYRQLPIPQLHALAMDEAEATECVAELGGNTAFWSYLDKIFATTNSNDSLDPTELPRLAGTVGVDVKAFNDCLSSNKYEEVVKKSIEEGYKAGVRGTPTSFIIAKSPLSASKISALNTISTDNGLSAQNLMVSSDKKTILIGGALPLDLMKKIVDVLVK